MVKQQIVVVYTMKFRQFSAKLNYSKFKTRSKNMYTIYKKNDNMVELVTCGTVTAFTCSFTTVCAA